MVFFYLQGEDADASASTTESGPASTEPTAATVDPQTADREAKLLLESALVAVDTAYSELLTFDPDDMTPESLNALDRSIAFSVSADESPLSNTTAQASRNEIDYTGDEVNCTLATQSASGNIFGIVFNQEEEGYTKYFVNGVEQDWDTQVPPRTTTTIAPETWVLYQDYELGCSFEYPASWVGHALTDLGVQAVGEAAPRLVIADPSDALAQAGTPTDFIVFFGAVESEENPSARSVIEDLEDDFDDLYPDTTITTNESIADLTVNGMPASSWGFRATGGVMPTAATWKYVAVSAGDTIFLFCFGSDESQWEANEVIFDATLDTFQMTLMPPPLVS